MTDRRIIPPFVASDWYVAAVKKSIELERQQQTPAAIKLLVTYFPGGDAFTEVVDSRSECMAPDQMAEWIAADGFNFTKAELMAIAKACGDRLAAFEEVDND